MSWLFGLNKQGTIGDAPQVPVLDDGSGSDGGDKESNTVTPVGSDGDTGYRSEAYSFDSSALERAAKAAKVRSVVYLMQRLHGAISKRVHLEEYCFQEALLPFPIDFGSSFSIFVVAS